jgi:hypothetical protein
VGYGAHGEKGIRHSGKRPFPKCHVEALRESQQAHFPTSHRPIYSTLDLPSDAAARTPPSDPARARCSTPPPPTHTHPTEQPPTHPSRTRARTHLRSTRRRREAIRRERRRAIRREGAGAGAGRRRPHAPPGDGLELLPTAASTSLPAQPPRPGLDLPL